MGIYYDMVKANYNKLRNDESVMWGSIEMWDKHLEEMREHHPDKYWDMINAWKAEPVVDIARKKGPVSFAVRAVRNTGRVFLVHVNNAVNNQKLLHREAYRLTGMKGDTFHSVVKSNYFLGV